MNVSLWSTVIALPEKSLKNLKMFIIKGRQQKSKKWCTSNSSKNMLTPTASNRFSYVTSVCDVYMSSFKLFFFFFFWCLLCKLLDYVKLFKNQIQVYQNTKKRHVLEILSGLLSQLSAGGIASRFNESEDALILTVSAKYSDFWKCLLVNAAVY